MPLLKPSLSHIARYDPLRFPRYRGTETFVQASKSAKNTCKNCSTYSFTITKIFDSYNFEWLEYVVDCRKGGTKQTMYDIVEGGVANDNVIDTVEDYENNVITAEQAIGQLKYKAVNHQLCILNQEIVDNYLSFVSSEQIEKED